VTTSSLAAIKVPDHDAALKAANDKTAPAYAADRAVLVRTALVRGQGRAFALADLPFTYEPDGLTMRRDAVFNPSGRPAVGIRSRW
jgi:ABC-type amino acid transport substrate-binding protein